MNPNRLIIGTRGSDLALYQANFIKDKLTNLGISVELKIIKTSGDKIDYLSFDKMEGKGFFTKELEDALLSRDIDLAVHSLKDLMTTQPDGLKLGAVGFRADRRELLLIRKDAFSGEGVIPVKKNSIVGTSSNRRKCQIAYYNKSLMIRDLRGNVPTRVKKLRDGQYDAILLAVAGVKRLDLDLSDLETVYLDPTVFLPAPAQGILGIQIRDEKETEDIISQLNDHIDTQSAALERGLLAKFDSGCSLPLGVYSEVYDKEYTLKACLGELQDEEWNNLKTVEMNGNDIDSLVENVYNDLTKG